MSDSIQLAHPSGATGRNLYAIVRASDGTVWNGTGFETYTTANLATYAIALAEQGASRFYSAAWPTSLPAGSYAVCVYDRAGGSAAEGDALVSSNALTNKAGKLTLLY